MQIQQTNLQSLNKVMNDQEKFRQLIDNFEKASTELSKELFSRVSDETKVRIGTTIVRHLQLGFGSCLDTAERLFYLSSCGCIGLKVWRDMNTKEAAAKNESSEPS